jgi:hypothetical protein
MLIKRGRASYSKSGLGYHEKNLSDDEEERERVERVNICMTSTAAKGDYWEDYSSDEEGFVPIYPALMKLVHLKQQHMLVMS